MFPELEPIAERRAQTVELARIGSEEDRAPSSYMWKTKGFERFRKYTRPSREGD